jgi:hypothetical protein
LPTTLHKRDHRPARSLRIAVTAPSCPCYPCTTSRFRMQMTLRRGTHNTALTLTPGAHYRPLLSAVSFDGAARLALRHELPSTAHHQPYLGFIPTAQSQFHRVCFVSLHVLITRSQSFSSQSFISLVVSNQTRLLARSSPPALGKNTSVLHPHHYCRRTGTLTLQKPYLLEYEQKPHLLEYERQTSISIFGIHLCNGTKKGNPTATHLLPTPL